MTILQLNLDTQAAALVETFYDLGDNGSTETPTPLATQLQGGLFVQTSPDNYSLELADDHAADEKKYHATQAGLAQFRFVLLKKIATYAHAQRKLELLYKNPAKSDPNASAIKAQIAAQRKALIIECLTKEGMSAASAEKLFALLGDAKKHLDNLAPTQDGLIGSNLEMRRKDFIFSGTLVTTKEKSQAIGKILGSLQGSVDGHQVLKPAAPGFDFTKAGPVAQTDLQIFTLDLKPENLGLYLPELVGFRKNVDEALQEYNSGKPTPVQAQEFLETSFPERNAGKYLYKLYIFSQHALEPEPLIQEAILYRAQNPDEVFSSFSLTEQEMQEKGARYLSLLHALLHETGSEVTTEADYQLPNTEGVLQNRHLIVIRDDALHFPSSHHALMQFKINVETAWQRNEYADAAAFLRAEYATSSHAEEELVALYNFAQKTAQENRAAVDPTTKMQRIIEPPTREISGHELSEIIFADEVLFDVLGGAILQGGSYGLSGDYLTTYHSSDLLDVLDDVLILESNITPSVIHHFAHHAKIPADKLSARKILFEDSNLRHKFLGFLKMRIDIAARKRELDDIYTYTQTFDVSTTKGRAAVTISKSMKNGQDHFELRTKYAEHRGDSAHILRAIAAHPNTDSSMSWWLQDAATAYFVSDKSGSIPIHLK